MIYAKFLNAQHDFEHIQCLRDLEMGTLCGDRAFVKRGWGLLCSMYPYGMDGGKPVECFMFWYGAGCGVYSCTRFVRGCAYCLRWCYCFEQQNIHLFLGTFLDPL